MKAEVPVNLPLNELLAQIDRLAGQPGKEAQRAACCQEALSRLSWDQNPGLCARLHMIWGACLLQGYWEDPVGYIEDAICHIEKARAYFAPYPQDRRLWAEATQNLADAFLKRACGDPRENLARARNECESLLGDYTRQGSPVEWARLQFHLGRAWKNDVWWEGGDPLDRAIAHFESALAALERQPQPLLRARVQLNLGNARLAFTSGGRRRNIEAAIACYQDALRVFTAKSSPNEWADAQENLGVALMQRLEGDPVENLEEAIAAFNQVRQVQTRQAAPVAWAEATCRLADAYVVRVRGGRLENIERALPLYQDALRELKRLNLPHKQAAVLLNQAIAYGERIQEERLENLKKAAGCIAESIGLFRPNDRVELACARSNAVDIFWKYAAALKPGLPQEAEANLEKAARYGKEALDGSPPPARLALICYNLGNVYSDWAQDGNSANQEQGINYYQKALGYFTPENAPDRWANTHNNLGVTYMERRRGRQADNLAAAEYHFLEAMRVHGSLASPLNSRRTARNLGHLYFLTGRWEEAARAYRQAQQAALRLYQASLLRASKQAEIRENAALAPRLAYALARLGKPEEAVEAIENGRAQMLSEALARAGERLEPLARVRPDLAERYREITGRIEAFERQELKAELGRAGAGEVWAGDRDGLAASLEAAYTGLQALLGEIRLVQGFADFLLPAAYDRIRLAARPAPLVYLLATPAGGLALIIQPEGRAASLRLDGLAETELRFRIEGGGPAQAESSYLEAYLRSEWDLPGWQAALERVTGWLWGICMGPVTDYLLQQGFSQAVLVPQGLLGLLPLHAAWTQDPGAPGRLYALDRICLTYAPNAQALLATQARAGAGEDSLLVVANPDGSLPFAESEADAALQYFKAGKGKRLAGQAAQLSEIVREIPVHHILHFATHGGADYTDPLQGCLKLADGRLTLGQILSMRLASARLAILSACETALPGTDLPDEVISLPSGLIQAGVGGAIGTLWPVKDIYSMLLVARFYRAWKKEKLPPAEALRLAQQWLRKATLPEKAAFLDTAGLPEWRLQTIQHELRDLESGELAHPFAWGAFGYTGS
jgi:CHAT domain-containing protein